MHKIAFFIAEGGFGSNISAVNAIRCLKNEGYAVDIFLYKAFGREYVDMPGSQFFIYGAYGNSLAQILAVKLASFFRLQRKSRDHFFSGHVRGFFKKKFLKDNYDLVFAVDSKGLILAREAMGESRAKIIYYSMELYYEGHPGLDAGYLSSVKEFERKFIKDVEFIIIQDAQRAECFMKDLHLEKADFVYVPVGAMGDIVREKTSYLHQACGISQDRKIVLQTGNINQQRLSTDIAKAAKNLESGYCLVYHGIIMKKIIKEINRYNIKKNILISDTMVNIDKTDNIIASAYAGLVFYKGADLNSCLIGRSSGQLAQFMKCGVPVIAINLPSLSIIIQKYKCGVVVDATDQIPMALETIKNDYDNFRKNAFDCYLKEYEYGKNFQKVLTRVKNIIK